MMTVKLHKIDTVQNMEICFSVQHPKSVKTLLSELQPSEVYEWQSQSGNERFKKVANAWHVSLSSGGISKSTTFMESDARQIKNLLDKTLFSAQWFKSLNCLVKEWDSIKDGYRVGQPSRPLVGLRDYTLPDQRIKLERTMDRKAWKFSINSTHFHPFYQYGNCKEEDAFRKLLIDCGLASAFVHKSKTFATRAKALQHLLQKVSGCPAEFPELFV